MPRLGELEDGERRPGVHDHPPLGELEPPQECPQGQHARQLAQDHEEPKRPDTVWRDPRQSREQQLGARRVDGGPQGLLIRG